MDGDACGQRFGKGAGMAGHRVVEAGCGQLLRGGGELRQQGLRVKQRQPGDTVIQRDHLAGGTSGDLAAQWFEQFGVQAGSMIGRRGSFQVGVQEQGVGELA